MESRLRATPDQFMTLLKYMESHGDLGRPLPGVQGRMKADRLWHQLGKLLNSSAGGVTKSLDKWKKVWADWKAKSKKKALTIRRQASSGVKGSKLILTAPEKRVLGVMGIKVVVGPVTTEKLGFEEPIKSDPLSPTTSDPAQMDYPSYSATDDVVLDFIPIYSMDNSSTAKPAPSSELSRSPSPHVPTPPPARVSTQTPPHNATASRKVARRWRPASIPAVRQQRLIRTREKVQTSFQRCANEFASIEVTRLQLEVEREKNNHQKEMERLRLESRRIEMEENRNQTLNRLVGVLDKLTEILPQLRPSQLPLTDTT